MCVNALFIKMHFLFDKYRTSRLSLYEVSSVPLIIGIFFLFPGDNNVIVIAASALCIVGIFA